MIEEEYRDMGSQLDVKEISEREAVETKVEVLYPEGFGYGDGSISVKTQLASGELSKESLAAAIDIVLEESDVFVSVDLEANDDGCGDGRITAMVYRLLDPVTQKIERYKRSLRRAKLFGGGLATASSMWRAVEGASDHKTLKGDRTYVASLLKDHGIHHGAHTAVGHNDGDNCGCGAIDNYELISRNATKYKDKILSTCKDIYGQDFDENEGALMAVFDLYGTLSDEYFADTNGKDTMAFIESEGAIVKELTGDHKEAMVVVNDVEGTTFDQDALRRKLQDRGLSPDIQAFVVDMWRGRMYADFIADNAAEHGHERNSAYKLAYADFLIRTLAISATLTAGDQVVIYRSVA